MRTTVDANAYIKATIISSLEKDIVPEDIQWSILKKCVVCGEKGR
jgi:hypothetical protein